MTHDTIGAPSDHLPVRLTFNPTNPDHHSPNTTYPTEVVYSKEFRELVYHLLAEYKRSPNYKHTIPHRNTIFKLAVTKAIKTIRKEKRSSFIKEDRLLTAIRALKALNNNDPKLAKNILAAHPSIISSYVNDASAVQQLKQFINSVHATNDHSTLTTVNDCSTATQFGGLPSNPPPNGTSALFERSEHTTTPSTTPPQVSCQAHNKRDEPSGLQEYLASTKLKSNYLQRISSSLPNTKTRFSSLRAQENAPTTTNPTNMTTIAANFWTPAWAWEPHNNEAATTVLNNFNRKISQQDIIEVNPELCAEVIMQSGNTASGPDGIPFSVYKAMIEHTAPMLNDTYHYAAANNPPAPGTNHSLLHLLPKTESNLICDSRPISVGNADVRLLGSVIHRSIYTACEKIISNRQKGFMKDRQILDNIKQFDSKFHSARRQKSDYDILFIDFKKAFDSLNHEFLIRLLHHIHIPNSTINVVRYLLTELTALTTFRGTPPAKIQLGKGVKQGCPLSPLLFILVMEVLDDAIIRPPHNNIDQNDSDIDSALYADDAAYASHRLADFILELNKTFWIFGEATGLHVNVTKSCIVKARPTSATTRHIAQQLSECSWCNLPIRPWAKWLGTLVGSKVTPTRIFANALAKFKNRALSYLPLKSHYSLPNRILIANVFLLPIFSYLYQLYIIPDTILKTVNSLLYRWLIPFNSLTLADLSRPANRVGLPNALQDLRLMNIAALITNTAPDTIPAKASKRHLLSSSIATHHKHALTFTPSGNVTSTPTRSSVYKALINCPSKQLSDTKRVLCKLDRLGLVDSNKNIFNNYNIIHVKTPNFVRLTTIKAIHNALPTAQRLRFFPSHIHPDTTCPLGCNERDSMQHLFGACEPVRHNYNATCQLFDLPKIDKQKWNFGTLLGATELLGRKQATFNCYFLFTAWQARTDSLEAEIDLPYFFSSTISNLLTRYCPQLIKEAFGKSLPPLPPQQRHGSSGKRSKSQQAAARLAASKLVSSLPSNSSIAYTDGGTHNSNPGPCGSGIFFPATATHQQTNLHYPLGWGTNNLGEIAAIGFAISHFLRNSPPKHVQLHILTDSYLAYGCLTFYWRSDLYAPLIRLIRKIISHIKHSNLVTIHWIAGHAGIAGNESADANATKAASMSNDTPADLGSIITDLNTNFNASTEAYNFNSYTSPASSPDAGTSHSPATFFSP